MQSGLLDIVDTNGGRNSGDISDMLYHGSQCDRHNSDHGSN